MSSVDRDADRRRLEREILEEGYQRLLARLSKRQVFLDGFASWGAVIDFMRRASSRDPAKEGVLLPIVQAHAADRDPRWRTILLVIFWPALESICRRKRHWDSDPDTLWANVVWAFLQTVCRLDPARRPDRLVQKIVNDVFHRLHDEYRSRWDRAKREVVTDPVELADHDVEDEHHAGVEALWVEQEARIAVLKAHHMAGRISDADFLLLVGTQVYGRPLSECAHESGLSYEAAKKRQQRAIRAIGGLPPNES
ncbi:hypothetical protein RAS1_41910 [Phycisphaerae bacterium RAS1]|nr:hypothetical protein RAS1_41910 [Phycisphaerae bacterium RAS1]